jgi:hypothetical protein
MDAFVFTKEKLSSPRRSFTQTPNCGCGFAALRPSVQSFFEVSCFSWPVAHTKQRGAKRFDRTSASRMKSNEQVPIGRGQEIDGRSGAVIVS